MKRALFYLLAITVAEMIVVLLEPAIDIVTSSLVGITCHIIILIVVIIDASLISKYLFERLVLSLAIIPIIRIVSLSLPLTGISHIWQFPIIYLPLLASAIVLIRLLNLKAQDIGMNCGFIPVQLMIGLSGIGFGIVEYLILAPEALVAELNWQTAWLPALVLLLSTGFVEELIFRGILQKTAMAIFDKWGIFYVSYIFAILHVGWIRTGNPITLLDIAFVFIVALVFGWIVKKTGSLLGVTLAHGITNIVLFIVAPFYF